MTQKSGGGPEDNWQNFIQERRATSQARLEAVLPEHIADDRLAEASATSIIERGIDSNVVVGRMIAENAKCRSFISDEPLDVELAEANPEGVAKRTMLRGERLHINLGADRLKAGLQVPAVIRGQNTSSVFMVPYFRYSEKQQVEGSGKLPTRDIDPAKSEILLFNTEQIDVLRSVLGLDPSTSMQETIGEVTAKLGSTK